MQGDVNLMRKALYKRVLQAHSKNLFCSHLGEGGIKVKSNPYLCRNEIWSETDLARNRVPCAVHGVGGAVC